jgi:hypothetical protein
MCCGMNEGHKGVDMTSINLILVRMVSRILTYHVMRKQKKG